MGNPQHQVRVRWFHSPTSCAWNSLTFSLDFSQSRVLNSRLIIAGFSKWVDLASKDCSLGQSGDLKSGTLWVNLGKGGQRFGKRYGKVV